MKLTMVNGEELTRWMNERRGMGRDMRAIKGPAPDGSTYNDGTPIERPVNIAWRDVVSGEVFAIEYEVPNCNT